MAMKSHEIEKIFIQQKMVRTRSKSIQKNQQSILDQLCEKAQEISNKRCIDKWKSLRKQSASKQKSKAIDQKHLG